METDDWKKTKFGQRVLFVNRNPASRASKCNVLILLIAAIFGCEQVRVRLLDGKPWFGGLTYWLMFATLAAVLAMNYWYKARLKKLDAAVARLRKSYVPNVNLEQDFSSLYQAVQAAWERHCLWETHANKWMREKDVMAEDIGMLFRGRVGRAIYLPAPARVKIL